GGGIATDISLAHWNRFGRREKTAHAKTAVHAVNQFEFKEPSYRLKAPAKQIRRFDKERPAIAADTRFKLTAEWIESVSINVVVITCVQSGAGTRRPREKKLSSRPGIQSRIVNAHAYRQ